MENIRTRTEMFDYLASSLSGNGIEFGAGAYPFPVGGGCRVLYADRNSVANLEQRGYFGAAKVIAPDLTSDFQEMEGISDNSLDFIIASHVIEHTSSPLRALKSAYAKLRTNGQLVLIIPDMEVTFDKDRQLTSLDHLILDLESPSRERDWEHYLDFFQKCFPQPDPVSAAKGPFEEGHDIHFHTWTYDSFEHMVNYVREKIDPWSAVWSYRRLSPQDIEFYFVLVK